VKGDILPLLGNAPLRQLTPQVIQAFAVTLREEGRGDPTIRKILSVLQGILQRAVEGQRIKVNPVKAVKKPAAKSSVSRTAHPPMTVESLRWAMPTVRDSTFVSVIAYAGLRPGEALAMTWGDVREQSLFVTKALALGEVKETKTGNNSARWFQVAPV